MLNLVYNQTLTSDGDDTGEDCAQGKEKNKQFHVFT